VTSSSPAAADTDSAPPHLLRVQLVRDRPVFEAKDSYPRTRTAGLGVLVDGREQYRYRLADRRVTTARLSPPAGDYRVAVDGRFGGAVEHKSPADLVMSLTTGSLRYATAEPAAL
jgi:ERCC4-type nuclease